MSASVTKRPGANCRMVKCVIGNPDEVQLPVFREHTRLNQLRYACLLYTSGICLILIALLVRRFTRVFTLEEDYREIGIMKATGFRDFQIKKIYLAKYLALVTSGSLIGLLVSIPVSKAMIKSVSINLIMEDSKANLWVNLICTDVYKRQPLICR